MKSLVIFAAVLLFCQAAKVPQEVSHQVTVTLPSNVLAAAPRPSSTTQTHPSEIPAHVVEVTKNQKPKANKTNITPTKPEVETTTMSNEEITTTMPTSTDSPKMLRKIRAVPFMDKEQMQPKLTTDLNKIKTILAQKKPTMTNTMTHHRSMRSLVIEMKTEKPSPKMPATQNPIITPVDAPMSTIDPCDLLCTKFEFEPICATNGLCLHEFPNQCILDTYNCKHDKHKFSATKDDRCQMHWLTKCDESELI